MAPSCLIIIIIIIIIITRKEMRTHNTAILTLGHVSSSELSFGD